MSLSQRPALRFYAAFYRWNRYTHARPQCPLAACHQGRGLRQFRSLISSTNESATTRANGQDGQQTRRDEAGIIDDLLGIEKDNRHVQHLQQDTPQDRDALKREEESLEEDPLKEESGPVAAVRPDTQAQKSHNPDRKPKVSGLQPDKEAERLQKVVRKLMRNVPHPVVVLTAAAVDPESNKPLPLGSVVSSFNTVTLDPPTVSFNIKNPSQTLDAIRADDGCFRAHFLLSRVDSAHIADTFAQGNTPETFAERGRLAEFRIPTEVTDGNSQGPVEIVHEVVAASMECKCTQQLTVGDHVIVVAQVLGVKAQPQDREEPFLLYVQGNYIRTPSEPLRQRIAPNTIKARLAQEGNNPRNHMLWSAPLFPKEIHRERFKHKMIQYVRNNPELLDLSLRDARNAICSGLSIPAGVMGLRLNSLIVHVAQKAKRKVKAEPVDTGFPMLQDFYGPLSSDDIKTIIERAKNFVRNDPRFLSMHYDHLFTFLGLSTYSTGILATDIMNALRAEGLVGPFQPFEGDFDTSENEMVPTLERLEQVEYKLRDYMQTQQMRSVMVMPREKLTKAIGGTKGGWVNSWVKVVRVPLQVEAFPEFYDDSQIEFSGHLSAQEARVALSRILQFVNRSESVLDKYLSIPWWEILRQCKIHPLVSGFDAVFQLDRLKYWHGKCDFHGYRKLLADKLGQSTQRNLKTEELQIRINELVQVAPMRAVTWGKDDIMTALGLRHDAQLVTGSKSNDGQFQYQLEMGHLVQCLRPALQERYNDFSVEEKHAVDRFLEEHKETSPPIPNRAANEANVKIAPSDASDNPLEGHSPPSPRVKKSAKILKVQGLNSADEMEQILNLSRVKRTDDEGQRKSQTTEKPKGFTAYGFDGRKS